MCDAEAQPTKNKMPAGDNPWLREEMDRFIAHMGDPAVRPGLRRAFRSTVEEMARASVSVAAAARHDDGRTRQDQTEDPTSDD